MLYFCRKGFWFPLKKSTVLICDDNIAVHKSIASYLAEDGINVLSAYDGESALQILADNIVDLMILDVMLPDKSGMHICREIRKTSEMPIIMLSAKDSEIDRILGLRAGRICIHFRHDPASCGSCTGCSE